MAKPSRLVPLPDILAPLLKTHGMASRLLEFFIRERWLEIAGQPVGGHTWPHSIRHHKLYLLAENSVWLQQLLFLKPELLIRLNAAAAAWAGSDGTLLTDIVLRVGAAQSICIAQDRETGSPGGEPLPEDDPDWERFASETAGSVVKRVTDLALRAQLRALFLKAAWSTEKPAHAQACPQTGLGIPILGRPQA